jgi:hypothetical protein
MIPVISVYDKTGNVIERTSNRAISESGELTPSIPNALTLGVGNRRLSCISFG